MKTVLNLKGFFYHKQQSLCGKYLPSLLSFLSRLPQVLQSKPTETMQLRERKSSEGLKRQSLRTSLLALAGQVDAHLALRTLTLRRSIKIIVGVLLLAVLAPLAETAYTYLDKNDTVPSSEWYYQSWFMLFLCIGPQIDKILTFTGLYFILVHQPNKFKNYVFAYPIGMAVGKIIWLCRVTSHEEFHSVEPWQYLISGISFAVFFIFLLEKLVWFNAHRQEAIVRRKQGLKSISMLIPAEQFRDAALKTMEQEERVQQYYMN